MLLRLAWLLLEDIVIELYLLAHEITILATGPIIVTGRYTWCLLEHKLQLCLLLEHILAHRNFALLLIQQTRMTASARNTSHDQSRMMVTKKYVAMQCIKGNIYFILGRNLAQRLV
jgi:hypothetical protein